MLLWISAFYPVAAIVTMRLTPNRQTPCPGNANRKNPRMPPVPDVSGTAALAICESLLLALNDRKIIPEREILGILKDAAAAHENVSDADGDAELHKAVAALIHRILAGGNSVRRP
jgi:hypothetical protein